LARNSAGVRTGNLDARDVMWASPETSTDRWDAASAIT
jgi:hypothetical protein